MPNSFATPVVTPSTTRKFEYHLEALRGFASLFVVWHHGVRAENHLDPTYSPTGIWSYNPPGHLSVLVFFVLSGYVIGLTNPKAMGAAGIWPYLRKRLLRLYPIYLLCLIAALIIARQSYPWADVVSHLTLTQQLLAHTFYELSPAWSLHFEFVYYLLFIPISFFNLRAGWVAVGAAAVGLLTYFAFPAFDFPILSAYGYGFSFWLCGLLIARSFPAPNVTPSTPHLVSALLLMLCVEPFNRLLLALQNYGMDLLYPSSVSGYWTMISFRDFTWLPYCLFFVLLFTGKDYRFRRVLAAALYALPALAIVSLLRNHPLADFQQHVLPLFFYGAALLLWLVKAPVFERGSRWVISNGIYLGSISYGIYLVHFPLIAVFQQVPFLAGTGVTFCLRFAVYLVAVLGLGHFLEKTFQPYVRGLFEQPKPRPIHV